MVSHKNSTPMIIRLLKIEFIFIAIKFIRLLSAKRINKSAKHAHALIIHKICASINPTEQI